ncbi:fibronectin type III domain protein [Dictyocaulus viviparus]|uniref:Fibronectin type III domain protein n=1 Tax=Dictyocaulus viviparus TaxID=29172 RepID=A0A0D8XCY3_DICVI|nr:fibronectin type III domain protein [Dictyocaulus viviparus]
MVRILGPGSPPSSVTVKNEKGGYTVSWLQPLYPNGNITKYVVYHSFHKDDPLSDWQKLVLDGTENVVRVISEGEDAFYVRVQAAAESGPGVISDIVAYEKDNSGPGVISDIVAYEKDRTTIGLDNTMTATDCPLSTLPITTSLQYTDPSGRERLSVESHEKVGNLSFCNNYIIKKFEKTIAYYQDPLFEPVSRHPFPKCNKTEKKILGQQKY